MVTMQNNAPAVLDLPALTAAPLPAAGQGAKFDLELSITETPGPAGHPAGLHGSLTASTDLFTPQTISNIAQWFQRVLTTVADNPQTRVSAVKILDKTERQNVKTS
jgi:non-ribosomal peptide synthetase component F